MAKTLANVAIWLDSFEITSSTNKVSIDKTAVELDATVFGDTSLRRMGGLDDAVISAAGFLDWVDPESTLFRNVGQLPEVPVSVVMGGKVIGNLAYFMQAEISQLSIDEKIGEIAPFTVKAAGSGRLCNGFLAQDGLVSANGNSAVYQLTAPAAMQAVGAAIHVEAFAGTAPTLTVILQSAATLGFASPTTRASFNVVNGVLASQYVEAVGPITDQFWRLAWTIGGSAGPSFTFTGLVGFSPG